MTFLLIVHSSSHLEFYFFLQHSINLVAKLSTKKNTVPFQSHLKFVTEWFFFPIRSKGEPKQFNWFLSHSIDIHKPIENNKITLTISPFGNLQYINRFWNELLMSPALSFTQRWKRFRRCIIEPYRFGLCFVFKVTMHFWCIHSIAEDSILVRWNSQAFMHAEIYFALSVNRIEWHSIEFFHLQVKRFYHICMKIQDEHGSFSRGNLLLSTAQ